MAEYSRIAKGSFVSTGAAQIINLPFIPDSVELWNDSVFAAGAAASKILSGYWDNAMGQGYADVFAYTSGSTLVGDQVQANGISTFSAGQLLQYGPQKQVIATTKASSSVNVSNHGYSVGTVVIFSGMFQSSTTGMPQLAGIPLVVTSVTDANNFVVNWNMNQSNYTALSGSPAGAYVRQVLYPYLYSPGVNFIEAISTGTTTTVTTAYPNNFVVGQEIAFRIPTQYGMTQLNSLPNANIPGSPIYGYVTAVSSSTQFVCNINSTGYTAFTTNQTVAGMVGNTFAQVLAVGDINSGGTPYSGLALYPSPLVNGVSTINGPAISGAYVNNTAQGFVIGAGGGVTVTAASLVGASTNVIRWRAYLSDFSKP